MAAWTRALAHDGAEKIRFSVQDYYRLAEVGILERDDRVELLDGEVLRMSPMGSRHAAHVNRFLHLLSLALGEDALVTAQVPLRLSDFSEPEPDVMVLEPREDFYADSHPAAGDVLLAVEISQTSLIFDRDIKLPLYAAAGLRELWIVDVDLRRLLVHRRPKERVYTETIELEAGRRVEIEALPGRSFSVTKLLGSP